MKQWIGPGTLEGSSLSVSFKQANVTMDEGGAAQLVVEISEPQAVDTTVTVSFTSQNGDEGTRFHPIAGPVVIPAGQTTQFFTLETENDNIYQGTEIYTLSLASAQPAVITNGSMTITLVDDDAAPTVNFSEASQTVQEGTASQFATVTLSRPSIYPITVHYSGADGSAISGVNYMLSPGTLTFAPMQTTKVLSFTMIDDHASTGALQFNINLDSIVGQASSGLHSQTVTEVDAESSSLSINSVNVLEGGGATFTISTSMASSSPQTVLYQTVDGTAISGVDYAGVSGMATIAANQLTTTVMISTLHTPGVCTPNRLFTVHLSSPTNAAIAVADGTGTIQDVDVPTVSIADGAAAEGSPVVITATLSAACPAHDITLNWSNSALTARAGVDFTSVTNQTATITAGQTTANLSTATSANHYNLGVTKTFQVTLNSATGATLATSTATGTITQVNSPPANPSLSLQDPVTSLTTYARQRGVNANITAATATQWCLSELQTTAPALGTSQCLGGSGSQQGWFTSLPTTFNLSSGDGSKTVYLWVSDANNNVNVGTVSATITLDTQPPATPTVVLADPTTLSTTLTSQNPATLTITGDTGAVKWCPIEMAQGSPAPTAPLFNNACWVATRPTTQTFGGTGARVVYVYTMDVADNVSVAAGTASITYSVGPTITSVSPTHGSAAGGTSITINGTGFLTGITATVGGNTCASPILTGSTQIVCTTPAGSVGAADVVVTNTLGAQPTGTRTATLAGGYTYDAMPTITVANVSGSEGTVFTFTATLSATTDVPVTFSWATSDGTALHPTNYTQGSGTGLTIAPGSTTQTFTVTTVDDNVATTDLTFNVALSAVSGATYTTPAVGTIQNVDAPTISSITRNSGTIGGGVSISIAGTGFLSGATVTLGSNACTSPNVVSTTQITCVTPAGSAGAVNVTVLNTSASEPHGPLSATANNAYTYESVAFRSAGTTLSQHIPTTSITLAAPTSISTGDIEIAQVWTSNSGSAATITPPISFNWTLIRSDAVYNSSAGKYVEQYLFYRYVPPGTPGNPSSFTFTTSVSSSHAGGVVVAYSGVQSSNPIDVANCNSGVMSTDGAVFAPAITTTVADDRLLFIGLDATTAVAAPLSGNIGDYDNSAVSGWGNFETDQILASTTPTSSVTQIISNNASNFNCQVALAPNGVIQRRSVGANYDYANGNLEDITLSTPSGVMAGDVMVAQFYGNYDAATALIPYTAPSGWVQIRSDVQINAYGGAQQYLFYKVATGSEPSSYTFTANQSGYYVNSAAGVIYAYSGVNNSAPIDVASCNSSNTGYTSTSPSVTPTQTGDLLMNILTIDGVYGILPGLVQNLTQEWFNADSTNHQMIYGGDRNVPVPGTVESTNSMQTGYYSNDTYFTCHIALIP